MQLKENGRKKKKNPYRSNSGSGLPEGFTLGMAVMDALPVILFCCSMLNIALRFCSRIFIIGAVLSSLAGLGKVIWKFLIALAEKNVALFAQQFRYFMSAGFLLMLLSIVMNRKKLDWDGLCRAIFNMPSLLCFIMAIVGMILMGICAARLDKTDAKSNWLEQGINTLAQFFLFLGILFI